MRLMQIIMDQITNRSSIIMAFAVACALFLTGCVQVNFPQINTVYDMMNPPTDPLDKHRWDLQVGEYKTQMYLLTIDGESVFVNENKDILVLRGNSLVSISIPKVTTATIVISDKDIVAEHDRLTDQAQLIRTITVNDTLYETQQCDQWIRTKSNTKNKEPINFVPLSERQIPQDFNQAVLRCVGAEVQLHTVNYVSGQLQSLSQYVPYINRQISLKKVLTR